jgi:uncharacterized glyoxalase superfamily protein PhnB
MKTKIHGARFVLAVQDLVKSAKFYETKLGFTTRWVVEGWHCLERENFVVMLGECRDDRSAFETKNHSYYGYLDVENIDALYSEFKSNAVEILSSLRDQPWGQREFSIRTIDGHRIMFGESIDES